MYIIAKDGSGDFTSIQQAIDAIPGGGRTPTILLLRMDEYQERVVVDKDNVRIIGEARDRTVITAKGCASRCAKNGTAGRSCDVSNHTADDGGCCVRRSAG